MNRIFVIFGLNSLLPAKTLPNFHVAFFTLPPLTVTSFKARDVALKYARLLKIGILALDQPGKGNFIVSKFEYSKCIGSRHNMYGDPI